MDSALRTVQSTVNNLSGRPERAATHPPLEGPPDLDAATSELTTGLARIALRTPMNASAILSAAREVFEGAVKSYSSLERNGGHWAMLPIQLPLSLGTLLTEQGLRGLYISQIVGPDRFPGFVNYMLEVFNDVHVYLSLQYREEAKRQLEVVRQNPKDAGARITLGRTYIKCGMFEEAARELKIAAMDPAVRAEALYESTVAQYRAGNYRQAVKDGAASLALDLSSDRTRLWLWLAAQKLNGYPPEVPAELQMEMKVGYHPTRVKFEDVAAEIGLDKTSASRGTAVFDFDGDGYLDVVVAATHGGCTVYHNNGDGTFTDVTIGSGLEACVDSFALAVGDYNNDGLPDLFITRYGFFSGECALYRNNGDGTFTEVTEEAGVKCWGPGFTANWADYDGDGFLDLFVSNNLGSLFDRKTPNRLFHNNGDGTFTEVSGAAGICSRQPTIGCAWGDYNNDGRPDLFVSSGVGRPQLYRNNGDGTFTDVSREAGVDAPCFGSVAFWFDYDNDGWLDLAQMVWSPPDDVFYTMSNGEGPARGNPMRIFHNNRNGTFTQRNRDLGINGCFGTMSGNAGDFNNDGRMDLLLGNGSPHMDNAEPPMLLEADDQGIFHNVTFAAGLPFTGKGHGVNMADLAGDGRLCLIVASGGAYPGDLLTTSVFRPTRLPGNYLNLRLVGTKSNRDAIGARVVLRAGGREQHGIVSGGSGFGCLPFEQHFGLAKIKEIDSLRVRWPSGLEQEWEAPPINTTLRLTEGRTGWEHVYSPRKATGTSGK